MGNVKAGDVKEALDKVEAPMEEATVSWKDQHKQLKVVSKEAMALRKKLDKLKSNKIKDEDEDVDDMVDFVEDEIDDQLAAMRRSLE